MLYAATETQVWVSFDDGDHWESLRLDMPAISVRDLQVKDDSTCHCSDLVAATHGRGFWILDDVTPLRQAGAAQAATAAYLFKPEPALRVRFGTNDPTPWPPELPAGENPPPGAIIDYYLPAAAQGASSSTSSTQPARSSAPTPATTRFVTPIPRSTRRRTTDSASGRRTPPDCGLPLYWPAPPNVISTQAGMHRFSWDLHYAPIAMMAVGPLAAEPTWARFRTGLLRCLTRPGRRRAPTPFVSRPAARRLRSR